MAVSQDVEAIPEGREGVEVTQEELVKDEEKPRVILEESKLGVKDEQVDDFEAKYAKMKNSKMKLSKKAAELAFPIDSIRARLNLVGLDPFPITLSPTIRDVLVPRVYLAHKFGGNSQVTFPSIGAKKLAEHGIDNFAYMNTAFQTMAPQMPGCPGLFFSTGYDGEEEERKERKEKKEAGDEKDEKDDMDGKEEDEDKDEHYLFTRITTAPALWQFMGIYEMRPCPSLTADEWNRFTPRVKNTWANEINEKGWGAGVRARIRARSSLGRKPKMKEWVRFDDRPLGSAQMIVEAYNKGHEHLAVWTLKCVGYNDDLQKLIVDGYEEYKVEQEREKEKKKGTKRKVEEEGTKKGKARAATRNVKKRGKEKTSTSVAARRKEISDSDDEEGSNVHSDSESKSASSSDSDSDSPSPPRKKARKIYVLTDSEDESDLGLSLPLTSRGTRSRPKAAARR